MGESIGNFLVDDDEDIWYEKNWFIKIIIKFFFNFYSSRL